MIIVESDSKILKTIAMNAVYHIFEIMHKLLFKLTFVNCSAILNNYRTIRNKKEWIYIYEWLKITQRLYWSAVWSMLHFKLLTLHMYINIILTTTVITRSITIRSCNYFKPIFDVQKEYHKIFPKKIQKSTNYFSKIFE